MTMVRMETKILVCSLRLQVNLSQSSSGIFTHKGLTARTPNWNKLSTFGAFMCSVFLGSLHNCNLLTSLLHQRENTHTSVSDKIQV